MDNITFTKPTFWDDFWLLGSIAFFIVGPILWGLIAFVL